MRLFVDIEAFEWDESNKDKILKKHGLRPEECEEVFQDEKRQFFPDIKHSENEVRYVVIGKTQQEKLLFVAFTVRASHFRIISARPVNNKRERKLYE